MKMKNYEDEIKNLKEKIKNLDDRLTKLENNPESENSSSLEMNVAKNLKTLKNPQLVIICMKIEPNQAIEQIKITLKKWGIDAQRWFNHGHFSDYVLKKGFAYETGKKDQKKLFSLTSKGSLEFYEIKKKFKL